MCWHFCKKEENSEPILHGYYLYNLTEDHYNMLRNGGITDKQLITLFLEGVDVRRLSVSELQRQKRKTARYST